MGTTNEGIQETDSDDCGKPGSRVSRTRDHDRGLSRFGRARNTLNRVPESAIIAIVYLSAHGLMALNRGLFWDDWWGYRLSRSTFARFQKHAGGSIWPAEIYEWINSGQVSVWITRALCTALILVSLLAFAEILKSVRPMNRQDRLLTVLVAATFPVFAARVPIINATYIWSLCLFMVAWWLADRWADSKQLWLATIAVVLFFLSFWTASLLVFYSLVLLFLLYRRSSSEGVKVPDLIGFAKDTWLFLVPALLYVVVKVLVPAPSGQYEGYNAVNPDSFFKALLTTPTVGLLESFFKPIQLAATSAGLYTVFVLAVLVLLIAPYELRRTSHLRTDVALLGIGYLAFCVAVFPYAAVGKMPTLNGFDSRHQLLVPFGAGVMVVYLVRIAFGRVKYGGWMGLAVILVVIAGSVSADLRMELEYFREMYKTDSIVRHVGRIPQFKTGTAFMFDDRTTDLDVSGRGTWRFYEYTGIFYRVFGDETRFGGDPAGWGSFTAAENAARQGRGASFRSPEYKLSQYDIRDPQYLVVVERGEPDLRQSTVLARLIWLELADRAAFEREVSGVVTLKVSDYAAP